MSNSRMCDDLLQFVSHLPSEILAGIPGLFLFLFLKTYLQTRKARLTLTPHLTLRAEVSIVLHSIRAAMILLASFVAFLLLLIYGCRLAETLFARPSANPNYEDLL